MPQARPAVALPARRVHEFLLVLAMATAFVAKPTWAFDRFDDAQSPAHFVWQADGLQLALKADLRLGFFNLEGKGGPGYDSPTDTRTIGTRSPYVELEPSSWACRLNLAPNLAFNSTLTVDASTAYLEQAWFDLRLNDGWGAQHHLELGRHAPFVGTERLTVRYPLAGTIYWRTAETHLSYEVKSAGASWGIGGGVAVSLLRPLSFSSVQTSGRQRGTINVLSYGAERVYSGVSPSYGGKIELVAPHLETTLFAFVGRLAGEGGTDELRSNFDNLRDSTNLRPRRNLRWGGGRLRATLAGFALVAEGIASQESTLRRHTWYTQLAYAVVPADDSGPVERFEPMVRYEQYRLHDSTDVDANGRALRSPAPSQAITWDYDILTVGVVVTLLRDLVQLRGEYNALYEHNGVRALGIANAPFRNNEVVLELAVRF